MRCILLLVTFVFLLSCSKKDNIESIKNMDIIEIKKEPETTIFTIESIENIDIIEVNKESETTIFTENFLDKEDVFQYNYANGNGTIISQINDNYKTMIIRKHEDRFRILPSTMRPYGIHGIGAYDEPNINSIELFRLADGDYVNSMQVVFIRNLQLNGKNSSWVKIRDDNNRIGWLDMDANGDFYRDGIWSIIEILNVNDQIWTVRKMDGSLSVWETLNVYNNPGTIGTNVLFQFMNELNRQMGVSILAITEESDTIDGKTDYWVKIKDEQDRIGWIFGGYTSSERGGNKFRIPRSEIRFMFNLP